MRVEHAAAARSRTTAIVGVRLSLGVQGRDESGVCGSSRGEPGERVVIHNGSLWETREMHAVRELRHLVPSVQRQESAKVESPTDI